MFWEWPTFIWQGVAAGAVMILFLIFLELRAISKQLAVKIKLDHPRLFEDDE